MKSLIVPSLKIAALYGAFSLAFDMASSQDEVWSLLGWMLAALVGVACVGTLARKWQALWPEPPPDLEEAPSAG